MYEESSTLNEIELNIYWKYRDKPKTFLEALGSPNKARSPLELNIYIVSQYIAENETRISIYLPMIIFVSSHEWNFQ